jgi:hypothetical protein
MKPQQADSGSPLHEISVELPTGQLDHRQSVSSLAKVSSTGHESVDPQGGWA